MAQIEELLLDNYVDEDLALINNNFSTLNTDKAEQSALNAHEADNDNPHKVTKDQVGLGNVPNIDTSEAIENSHTHTNKTILDNIEVALTEQEKLRYQTGYEHTLETDNPHNVTKAQVGLSNVDNTSDASKPLSIATINALATKLDITTYNSGIALKANLTDVLTKTNTGVYIPTLDYHPATKKYVDDVVISTNNVWKRISGTIYPYVNNDNVNIGTGSMTANKFIINGAVENDSDAATKKYVDDQLSGENLWDRVGSVLSPHNSGDSINISGIITASNLSGTNTGDETQSTIKSKLGAASSSSDGYLTSTDWTTFNSKQPAGTYSTDIHSNITALNAVTGTNTGDQDATDFDIKDLTDSTNLRTTWSGKQNALGFTPENVANKVTSLSGSSTDTQYPSAKLVYDQLAGKQPTGNYITLASLSSSATGLTYTNTTGVFSLTTGYEIPTTTKTGTLGYSI